MHHALGAAEGLAKAREVMPDLILLDVDLPPSTGFDVCMLLKQEPATSGIPVIFLTAATEVSAKVHGFDLGAIDYVLKPFEPAELRARVRAALRTKRLHDLLSARAHIDGLTALWNRAYFDVRMEEEVLAALGDERDFSLVMLDIDHFKCLNDSYGHPFGDRVLQGVGEALHSSVRTADAPCRYGGEEFALILPSSSAADAMGVAERVRASIASLSFRPRDTYIQVTASFGVSSTTFFPSGRISVQSMIASADAALYCAKRGGRNRVSGVSKSEV